MILLVQSKTSGETLYPYLAANFAGALELGNQKFDFVDLNKTTNFKKPIYSKMYIFVSWVSIQSYEKNLSHLKCFIKTHDNISIKIICENQYTASELQKDGYLKNCIYDFSKFLIDYNLLNAHSNYNIISPSEYLFSPFLNESSLPIVFTYKISNTIFDRSISCVKEDLSSAHSTLGISSFIIEDSNWLEDNAKTNKFLKIFEHMDVKPRWLVLAGINISFVQNLPLEKMAVLGCRGISVEVKPEQIGSINLPSINNFDFMGYFQINNNIRHKEYIPLLLTVFSNTTINHYYYHGKRRRVLNIFCGLLYLLSLTNTWRLLRMTKCIKPNRNNSLKVFLKLRRIFK